MARQTDDSGGDDLLVFPAEDNDGTDLPTARWPISDNRVLDRFSGEPGERPLASGEVGRPEAGIVNDVLATFVLERGLDPAAQPHVETKPIRIPHVAAPVAAARPVRVRSPFVAAAAAAAFTAGVSGIGLLSLRSEPPPGIRRVAVPTAAVVPAASVPSVLTTRSVWSSPIPILVAGGPPGRSLDVAPEAPAAPQPTARAVATVPSVAPISTVPTRPTAPTQREAPTPPTVIAPSERGPVLASVPPAPALTASVLPNDVVPAAPVAAIAPVAETVASELPAAAEVRREASAAPVAPVPSPGEERVRQTVLSYRDAYESLNADAAAAVWPSVDRRALTRAFATLKSQGLEFRQCAITMNDTRATVSCRGTLRVVPKVGSSAPLAAEQQWIFRMRRSGADWTIDDVSSAQVAATARAGGQD